MVRFLVTFSARPSLMQIGSIRTLVSSPRDIAQSFNEGVACIRLLIGVPGFGLTVPKSTLVSYRFKTSPRPLVYSFAPRGLPPPRSPMIRVHMLTRRVLPHTPGGEPTGPAQVPSCNSLGHGHVSVRPTRSAARPDELSTHDNWRIAVCPFFWPPLLT